MMQARRTSERRGHRQVSYSSYYNRTGYVRILGEDGTVEDDFRGLNFKFSCEFASTPCTEVEAKCTVGILGLTGQHVHDLTTFTNGTNASQNAEDRKQKDTDDAVKKKIEVYAGYDGEGFNANSALFSMDIIGAWPTPPPNMWLNFSGMNGAISNDTVYDARMQSKDQTSEKTLIPFKQYINFVADGLNAKVDWPMTGQEAKTLELVKRWSWGIVGSESQIIRYLNETYPTWGFYIGHSPEDPTTKILHVTRLPWRRGSLEYDVNRQRFMNAISIAEEAGPTISAATGMIGFPKVTFGNGKAGSIEVKTLLRKDVGIGKNFTVKSEYIKFANATFKCNKIKHEGEFRGNAWYTTLYGIPPEYYQY